MAKNFFDVGMVPKNDVLQAEVQLAQAVQNRIVTENQLAFAFANLNTVLRRQLDDSVALEDVVERPHFEKGLEECLGSALVNRPEIQSAKKQLDASEQQVRLAKSGYYPSVAASYNLTKNGPGPTVSGGAYHDSSAWNVGAVATWSVWEWGQTSDDVQVARVNVEKSKNAIVQVEDNVRLGVKQAFLAVQAAEKAIVVAQTAIAQAEENYRMFLERYREQVATATELTNAQTLQTSAVTSTTRRCTAIIWPRLSSNGPSASNSSTCPPCPNRPRRRRNSRLFLRIMPGGPLCPPFVFAGAIVARPALATPRGRMPTGKIRAEGPEQPINVPFCRISGQPPRRHRQAEKNDG